MHGIFQSKHKEMPPNILHWSMWMFAKSITLTNVILLENDLNFFLSKCGLQKYYIDQCYTFGKHITLFNVILLEKYKDHISAYLYTLLECHSRHPCHFTLENGKGDGITTLCIRQKYIIHIGIIYFIITWEKKFHVYILSFQILHTIW